MISGHFWVSRDELKLWKAMNILFSSLNRPLCDDLLQVHTFVTAELTNTLMLVCLCSHLLPDRLSKGEEVWLFSVPSPLLHIHQSITASGSFQTFFFFSCRSFFFALIFWSTSCQRSSLQSGNRGALRPLPSVRTGLYQFGSDRFCLFFCFQEEKLSVQRRWIHRGGSLSAQ